MPAAKRARDARVRAVERVDGQRRARVDDDDVAVRAAAHDERRRPAEVDRAHLRKGREGGGERFEARACVYMYAPATRAVVLWRRQRCVTDAASCGAAGSVSVSMSQSATVPLSSPVATRALPAGGGGRARAASAASQSATALKRASHPSTLAAGLLDESCATSSGVREGTFSVDRERSLSRLRDELGRGAVDLEAERVGRALPHEHVLAVPRHRRE